MIDGSKFERRSDVSSFDFSFLSLSVLEKHLRWPICLSQIFLWLLRLVVERLMLIDGKHFYNEILLVELETIGDKKKTINNEIKISTSKRQRIT